MIKIIDMFYWKAELNLFLILKASRRKIQTVRVKILTGNFEAPIPLVLNIFKLIELLGVPGDEKKRLEGV